MIESIMEAICGVQHSRFYETELRIRHMKSRWGSCSVSRAILLNTELVKAPVHCIDYVIAHELCHFKYRKHGDQFYRFLGKLMPDWQDRKRRLERVETIQ